jgi:ABC-type uncharacterized transport system substrate-binding protein
VVGKRLELLKQAAPGITRVAFLGLASEWNSTERRSAQAAAKALGITLSFAEGRNLEIDVRYARTNPGAAQELLARKPDAILAATGDAVRAAQLATKSTPIVFVWVADPVLSGFVQAYGRPGGSTTGVANRYYELIQKRLELIHELLPGARRVGIMGRLHDPVFYQ